MSALRLMAVDVGAESGRCMLGEFDGARVNVEEVHRFPNGPVPLPDGLHWDVLRLFEEIKAGIRKAHREGRHPRAVGLDTWGVDFALLDRRGALVQNPYHYRDQRTRGMIEEACRRVPREEIFARTGIQFIPINALYQLLAMVVHGDPGLEVASTFLMMPDLFTYWLTGEVGCEFTDATTSQCYDPRAGSWAADMLERLGVPSRIFPPIIPPASVIGPLRAAVAEDIGLNGVTVIAPATHDTASAVAAVPAARGDFAYISSGTWSLVGAEVRQPVINDLSLAYNFTNEGGLDGTFRLLRNVTGLWLLQECRRRWQDANEDLTYDMLTREAAASPPFGPLINPDDERFLRPTDMPARIQEYCRDTHQRAPQSRPEITRCVLESLALKYRWVIERIDELLGRSTHTIHIVGGGSRNTLLSQFTADATGRVVRAGPVEATSMGNVLAQAWALGHLSSLEELRDVVRRSTAEEVYEPAQDERWEEAYRRFLALPGVAVDG